jgi:hypothetical protein
MKGSKRQNGFLCVYFSVDIILYHTTRPAMSLRRVAVTNESSPADYAWNTSEEKGEELYAFAQQLHLDCDVRRALGM